MPAAAKKHLKSEEERGKMKKEGEARLKLERNMKGAYHEKRILGVVTVILILLVCDASAASTVSTSAGMDEIPLPEEYDEGFFATQWESIGIFDKMLDSFQADAAAYDSSGAADGSTAYPDHYGGAYIDDSGKLVVLTTDMSDAVINEIRAAAGGDVAVAPCSVPLNELCSTVDLIVDHFELLREQGIEIATVQKDIMTGKVTVSVINLDAKKEAKIRMLVNYDYLEFENADGGWVCTAGLRAGAEIEDRKNNSSGTLGFPAVNSNGVKGFVTAGHVAPHVLDLIGCNNEIVGRVSKTSYKDGMTADASFVSVTNGNTVYSEVVNGYRIASALTGKVPIGTTVYMYGSVSKLTTGKIIDYGVSGVSESGYTFKEFWTADYKSDKGDSGGPVLVYNGASNYSIIGIECLYNRNYGLSALSPYSNIVDELGVTCVPYYA